MCSATGGACSTVGWIRFVPNRRCRTKVSRKSGLFGVRAARWRRFDGFFDTWLGESILRTFVEKRRSVSRGSLFAWLDLLWLVAVDWLRLVDWLHGGTRR